MGDVARIPIQCGIGLLSADSSFYLSCPENKRGRSLTTDRRNRKEQWSRNTLRSQRFGEGAGIVCDQWLPPPPPKKKERKKKKEEALFAQSVPAPLEKGLLDSFNIVFQRTC